MRVKFHPTFKRKIIVRQMAGTTFFLLAILVGVMIAINFAVWVVLSYAIVVILTLSIFSNPRDDLLREARCAECGRLGDLIKPLEYEKFYFLRCDSCEILWNLRVRFVNEDDQSSDGPSLL